MQNAPLVSVVIITYNQEQYVAQAIDCVLAQKTEYDYEIIIGEDCSTDNTREIVYRYQQQYPDKIRVIISDQNVGLLGNYYRTVKAARGKYIAGCAGDDYWHNSNKLQRQIHFMEDNPDCGMVHSDADFLKEDEGRLIKNFLSSFKIHFDNESDNTLDLLFTGRYTVVACTAVYRKIYFDDYFNLDELERNGILMEDMPLWIVIAAHSKIYYMAESFIVHREMKGTITNPQSFDKKMLIWNSCYNCFAYYFGLYKNKIKDQNINLKSLDQRFNRKLQKLAMEANRKDLVRFYYKNIVEKSGRSYLSAKDIIRYYSTYLPLGMRLYNIFLAGFYRLREIFGRIPQR